VDEQPNWKMILPAAAMAGFILTGFWGLLLGPIAAVPVVSWRRRREGAEPAGDEERRLAEFMAETLAASKSKPPAPKPPTTETVRPGFEQTKASAAGLDEAGLFESFAAARLALIENGRDAQAAAAMALLAKRLAPGEPLAKLRQRTAAQAIELCLANGQAAAAAGVFAEYLDERAALRLPPPQWEALGRTLLGQGNFMASAWALHAGALLAGDAAGAQKRLVEVADKASAAGQPAVALRLYRTLLGKYPDSPYAQFARENMKTEEKRLVTGRDTSGQG
jgi:TolA-binding protein